MKVLMQAAGTHGDVLPLLGLGRVLAARGHRVRVLAAGVFAPLAAEAGLDFTAVLPAAQHRQWMDQRDAITSPRQGLALLAQAVLQGQRQALPLLAQAQAEMEADLAAAGPAGPDGPNLPDGQAAGRTLLVGTSLAWATRLQAELTGTPVATLHLAPAWFRSEQVAPSFGPLGHLARAPRGLKRALFGLMDRRLLDPLFTAPLNAWRAGLGLAPVQRAFHHWPHQADLTLGLFPPWFAPPQPDWPAGLRLTGFPLHDPGADAPLPDEAERFLAAGPAPVVFTAGTASASAEDFFNAAVQGCLRSGRRAILLAQHAAPLRGPLPPAVLHLRWAPLSALLPRVAAFAHHGGIGSTSQALQAGTPQLLRPTGLDQFDNARRVLALGVGRQLLPRRWRADTVARALDDLLGDPALAERCARLAQRLRDEGGGPASLQAAADALEGLAGQPRRAVQAWRAGPTA